MVQFRKNFYGFQRDYDLQTAGPDLANFVLPVSVVDDNREYLHRTWPIYHNADTVAAVAAVYGYQGYLVGANAVRLIKLYAEDPGGSVIAYAGLFVTDLRTANQTTGTIGGVPRGTTGATTSQLEGTSTVSGARSGMLQLRNSTLPDPVPYEFEGLVLRPGEYLWVALDTVNVALTLSIAFEEYTFPMQPNPATLL